MNSCLRVTRAAGSDGFVLDASVSVCWAFSNDCIQTEEVMVPALWWFEVRNIFIVNERRGRIQEQETEIFLRALAQFRIRTDRLPEEDGVRGCQRKQGLTVYDAAYLELAYRERLPLATWIGA
jgi:predicted nucleic acid-binding protein